MVNYKIPNRLKKLETTTILYINPVSRRFRRGLYINVYNNFLNVFKDACSYLTCLVHRQGVISRYISNKENLTGLLYDLPQF